MLLKHEGRQVPQVIFWAFTEVGWHTLSTADLFDDKTVIAFAVPGAFTCPYSPIQLLGYNAYAELFQANGVDEILCISVNDPFSLAAWAREEGANRVHFIPDVNGDFTREMGMMVDLSERGMGQRSLRYSMLVKDGTIEKLFVEPDAVDVMPAVSNAETMLSYINPEAAKLEETTVLMQMWRAMLAS